VKTLSILLLATIGLWGCSSGPNTIQYYVLEDIHVPAVKKYQNPSLIVLHPPLLSAYLDQSSLVMQLSDHQLYYASQHIWAQSLRDSLASIMLSDLNAMGQSYEVISAHDPRAANAEYQLKINIEHLLPNQDEGVILSGQYWISAYSSENVIARDTFGHSVPLNEDGFANAVAQMRQAVRLFTQSLSLTLDAAIEP
jgi:uncharacterized lipoprotein YmbA